MKRSFVGFPGRPRVLTPVPRLGVALGHAASVEAGNLDAVPAFSSPGRARVSLY